jgi:hypothetical protein
MPRDLLHRLPQPVFDEPVFAEGKPTPDPTRFRVPHPSDAELYKRIEELLYKDVVAFPQSRVAASDLYSLETAWGPHGAEIYERIRSAQKIVFHTVGDIGASTAGKYPGEIRVSDAVTLECQKASDADRPAFLYLLGDLIYDFGEAQYYYDQFYDPYRNYPGPILAIPGNHDSFVVPGTPVSIRPLATFQRNFCAEEPVVTPEAGSLHRTAMTEPGVYFALDAPFVRILGLFSNALEDPGVISSENGKWKSVPDFQLHFLTAQLHRAKTEKFSGALLIAVHHPPFNYAPPAGATGAGGVHSGNPVMLAQIDRICQAEGVYPHAFLAGHAHNYQRYTRTIDFEGSEYEVPYIVCGGGGHDVESLVRSHLGSPSEEPANGADVSYLDTHAAVTSRSLVLDRHDDQTYGFLRVVVDAERVHFGFHAVVPGGALDTPTDRVSIDIASHTIASEGGSAPSATVEKHYPRRKR